MGRRATMLSLASLGLSTLTQCSPRGRRVRLDGAAQNGTTAAAQEIVAGRCGALIHVERVRDWVGRLDVMQAVQWAPLLEDTGIDPLRDVQRAYVTAKSLDDVAGCALVLDLAVDDDDRIDAALRLLAARDCSETEGDKTPPPAIVTATNGRVVRTCIAGEKYVVTRASRKTIVALPEADAPAIVSFFGCKELPAPRDGEALDLFAYEPSKTLDATITWPESLVEARASVELAGGAAAIEFVGKSTSEGQAERDAADLTRQVNDLCGVDLVLFKMPIFNAVSFHARGSDIEMATRFSRTEVDIILALVNL
ncbi:MAG: hypothetical protein HOW73_37415 [Polyangiaceae bacterium]|nr:hypothetical protein [Polyangiaceae bacterium]